MATVNEKMTALADKIRSKTGGTSKLSIDGMIDALDNIVAGGGVDDHIVGTWVFKEIISYPDSGSSFAVSFISNGEHYKAIERSDFLYYSVSALDETLSVYEDDGYGNYFWDVGEEYRTITITEEPTDGIFISWLKANAIKQGDYHFRPEALSDENGMLIQGYVIPHYYILEDCEYGSNGMQAGYKPGDVFVAYGYAKNNQDITVPVIYKTGTDYMDEGPDYVDVFYYVGTSEVDGITYDKWRKIYSLGIPHWEDDPLYSEEPGKIYVLTNIIVEPNSHKTWPVTLSCQGSASLTYTISYMNSAGVFTSTTCVRGNTVTINVAENSLVKVSCSDGSGVYTTITPSAAECQIINNASTEFGLWFGSSASRPAISYSLYDSSRTCTVKVDTLDGYGSVGVSYVNASGTRVSATVSNNATRSFEVLCGSEIRLIDQSGDGLYFSGMNYWTPVYTADVQTDAYMVPTYPSQTYSISMIRD